MADSWKATLKPIASVLFCIVLLVAAITITGVEHPLVLLLIGAQHELASVADLKLFTLGKAQLTLWSTVYLVVLTWLLVRVSAQVETWFVEKALAHTALDRSMREALGTTLRYSALALGLVVIVQSVGIDLSALTILAGAFGVAIGLGLQSMLTNVVGGLVILFERPIKSGDRIQVGDYTGDVKHISLRATTIVTNDNIAVIVPNSEFTSSKVINWTYTGRQCRFKIPVKVVLASDPAKIKAVLLSIADDNPGVLKSPPPEVVLDEFGDNSLSFSLLVWSTTYVTRPIELKSDIYFAIMQKFEQNGLLLLGQSKPEAPPNGAKPKASQQQLANKDTLRPRRATPKTKSA